MTAIVNTVEIARRPEEVFAYLDDVERHGEWQGNIVSSHRETDGPTRVGTRVEEVRHVGGRDQKMTYEVTEHEPPRTFGFRVLDGNVRAFGRGTVEPVGDGSRSRMTLTIDFEGHGVGKLIVPIARVQARKQVVADGERMKAKLESGGDGQAAATGMGESMGATPGEDASPAAGSSAEADAPVAEAGGAESEPPAPTV